MIPRVTLAALLLGLVFVGGCSRRSPATSDPSGAPAAPETVRFQLDWFPQSEHGGFYQAQAKGFYRAAGIDVAILSGRPSFTAVQSVLSGQSDLSMARSDDLIYAVSTGLPLVIVGAYMQHDPQAILIHDQDTVRRFPDLNGRTLMAGPGVSWLEYLKRKYRIDFRVIPVNYGLAEFMADPKFLQQCFLTNEPYYAALHGQKVRTLPISDSGYDPYRTIFTTRRFLREHPRAVRAFVAASLRGWEDFLNGDPRPAIAAILPLNAQMSEPLIHYSIAAMRSSHVVAGFPARGERLGLMTPARLNEEVRILTEIGIIPAPLPLNDFVTFAFVPGA